MNEDIQIKDFNATFDFKGFLLKLLSYWPLFLISLLIGFGIAYYINIRKLPIYEVENMIAIKDAQNPFFTSNTSLTFNWGGTTDKVKTSIITLKSRTHNEKVVDKLDYYINYYKQGKYQLEDVYGKVPFLVEIDKTKPQVLNRLIAIKFIDSVTFNLSLNLEIEENKNHTAQIYDANKTITSVFLSPSFSKEFKVGELIETPFFNGIINTDPEVPFTSAKTYYFNFKSFNSIVKRYMGIRVIPESKGSSVLNLRMRGTNKKKLVNYLNKSVAVLSSDMLERKNLFATKTIRFIDSSLAQKGKELEGVQNELNEFRDANSIVDLEAEALEITSKLNGLDIRKEAILQQLNYYNSLENYLITRTDYRNVPAPSVAGIDESSIQQGVSQIIARSQQRSKLEYSYKEDAPIFKDIDREIDALKTVLLENISSSKQLKNSELRSVSNEIARNESNIKRLPKEQQELLQIERRYNLSQNTYNLFLAKRSEAGLVRAANVSDVLIIDPAKDTGGGKVGPNTQLNYVMALIIGLLIPFTWVLLRVLLDTRIVNVKEVNRLSAIPILGQIGKSRHHSNLAVIDKPKSPISESFRAIRSSLQFFYKKQGVTGSKTVLVTSSTSGEGKTFCSINLASVFALSGKKTILVGLDLRKPKIFGDFEIDNNIGVVNYLIGESSLNEIIQKTMVDSLDVITSGPIPPNPSELLMTEQMTQLINQLKKEYDYIVLDSPPLGLVADSLELVNYADATIYMIRQNFTKKGMLGLINQKYKTREVNNISFVLNVFETKSKYGYGYGYGYEYGYGYGYGGGYQEVEEKASLWKRFLNFFSFKKKI